MITASTPTEESNPPVVAEVVVPDTPQQSKRSNRATNSHGRRKGNNRNASYRQSEDPHDAIVPPVMTRDASQNGQDKNTTISTKEETQVTNGPLEKASKPRLPQPKTSITDMNKRVNAIMEFIQRTQLEMANEKQRTYCVKSTANSPRVTKATTAVANTKEVTMVDVPPVQGVPQITISATTDKPETSLGSTSTMELSHMHSTEIMDILTRKLVHWQQTFGKMEKV